MSWDTGVEMRRTLRETNKRKTRQWLKEEPKGNSGDMNESKKRNGKFEWTQKNENVDAKRIKKMYLVKWRPQSFGREQDAGSTKMKRSDSR